MANLVTQVKARAPEHLKDLTLILERAAKIRQDLPLARTHSEMLRSAIEAGDGELDNSAVIREIRRRRL